MPKYTSRTGKDIVLRFNGTVITIPAHRIYETSAEDLAELFPSYIKKVNKDELLKEVERPIPPLDIRQVKPFPIQPVIMPAPPAEVSFIPLNIHKIIPTEKLHTTPLPPPELTPVKISDFHNIPSQNTTFIGEFSPNSSPLSEPKAVEMSDIYNAGPQKINKFSLTPPTELPSPIVKNVILKQEEIIKTINSIVASDGDPDVREFLSMIESVITN
jgi:hypothetical protein